MSKKRRLKRVHRGARTEPKGRPTTHFKRPSVGWPLYSSKSRMGRERDRRPEHIQEELQRRAKAKRERRAERRRREGR